MEETKFWVDGFENGQATDLALLPKALIDALGELQNKFKVEYDEETDAYYMPRKNYFAFKKAVKKTCGWSIKVRVIH